MINVLEKKEKIILYLKNNGPTLPVVISKVIEMDPFFASAILSEVLGEKRIKATHMRIGSSPLYFLEGQENQLEKMTSSLKSAEREAFEKLREKKILKDADETPAIRVALRSIRDFAIPFKLDEQVMWRYYLVTEDEVRKMFSPIEKKEEKLEKVEKEIVVKKERVRREVKRKDFASSDIGNNEPAKSFEKKVLDISPDKGEEKSEFFNEIKNYLEGRKIEFLEEIQSDKKEVVAKVSIDSDVGKINFLLVAKNKKSVSKEEINTAVQRATYSKMPCLIIVRKEPTKSIENFISNNNLIKIESMG